MPNFEALEPWAGAQGLGDLSRRELIGHQLVQEKLNTEVQGMLTDIARFERPKRIVLLEKDFTIESGELTPTLKVKRRVVEKNYAPAIDAAYAEAERESGGVAVHE